MGRILLFFSFLLTVILCGFVVVMSYALEAEVVLPMTILACGQLVTLVLGAAFTAREDVVDRLEAIENDLQKLMERVAGNEEAGPDPKKDN